MNSRDAESLKWAHGIADQMNVTSADMSKALKFVFLKLMSFRDKDYTECYREALKMTDEVGQAHLWILSIGIFHPAPWVPEQPADEPTILHILDVTYPELPTKNGRLVD